MALLPFLEIVALTFALSAWLYVRLPKPTQLWQIGLVAAFAYACPRHDRWLALAGLVLIWLAAMWLLGWATQKLRRAM